MAAACYYADETLSQFSSVLLGSLSPGQTLKIRFIMLPGQPVELS